MSITSARKFFEKSGCGTVFIIIAGAAMILTMIFTRGQDQPTPRDLEANSPALAMIGQYKVSEIAVNDSFNAMADQQRNAETGLSADDTVSLYASMVSAHVGSALIVDLGHSMGLNVTDEQLFDEAKKEVEKQLADMVKMLENMSLVKPGASQADIDKAYQGITGRTLQSVREEQLDNVKQSLATQAGRLSQTARFFSEKMKTRYVAETKVSDEELRRSFNAYTTKRIVFGRPDEVPPKEALEKAKQVLSDIKAGKITFDEAMNKYTMDPAPGPDKAKSDSTTDITQSIIDYDASLTSIPTLKPGEVSGVLQTSAGPGIFKLISVKSTIPSDFETNKTELMKVEVERKADRRLRDEIIKRRDGGAIQWKSKGAEALFMWNLAQIDVNYSTDDVKKKELLVKASELAKAADLDDTTVDPKWGILANYAVQKSLIALATPAEKPEIQADYVAAMNALTSIVENVELRLELVREYLQAKDKEAGAQLVFAAQANNTTGPLAQGYYTQIAGLRDKVKSAGLIEDADVKKVNEELKRWSDEVSRDLAYSAEGFLDYGAESITQYDKLMADVQKFESKGWLDKESKDKIDKAVATWKAGAFDAIKLEAEDNKDHSLGGQSIWKEIGDRIKGFAKIGALNATQTAELQKLQDQWKVGLFDSLKKESEENTDYTQAGQAAWSELNGRIQELVKLGALTQAQADQLKQVQAKWSTAKKAADLKAATEANKPPTTGPSATTGTTGSPFGPSTLPGTSTGTTGSTGR
ncbi:MAG: peptidylprolyl isomerase [Fimbriimonadaceae bacterium]|nr:peptidylprolyl isomerase [Fimbriimonadaceae bacterium]